MTEFGDKRRIRGAVFVVGGSFWLGLVFLTLGSLWLLDNLGFVDSAPIVRLWPVVLIVFGIARLTGVFGPRRPVWGAMLTGAGSLLLLNSLGMINFGFDELWAVALVFIGSMILYRSYRGQQERTSSTSASEKLNVVAVMGGVVRKIESPAFRGGEVTAVMGSVELDFRGARLEGDETGLELLVIMGGVELYVPPDWQVVIEAMPVMGAIEDQRKAPSAEARQKVRLNGFVMMGGVEIKDAPKG